MVWVQKVILFYKGTCLVFVKDNLATEETVECFWLSVCYAWGHGSGEGSEEEREGGRGEGVGCNPADSKIHMWPLSPANS